MVWMESNPRELLLIITDIMKQIRNMEQWMNHPGFHAHPKAIRSRLRMNMHHANILYKQALNDSDRVYFDRLFPASNVMLTTKAVTYDMIRAAIIEANKVIVEDATPTVAPISESPFDVDVVEIPEYEQNPETRKLEEIFRPKFGVEDEHAVGRLYELRKFGNQFKIANLFDTDMIVRKVRFAKHIVYIDFMDGQGEREFDQDTKVFYQPWFMDRGSYMFYHPKFGRGKFATEGDPVIVGQFEENREYYELTKWDVGKPLIQAFGQKWWVPDFMGRILPQDVGKRVYQVPCNDPRCRPILQVENDEQRAARLATGCD